jgi:hypothetical protein
VNLVSPIEKDDCDRVAWLETYGIEIHVHRRWIGVSGMRRSRRN